ncbi:hypothetical protein C0992_000350 [Termitomyces sp. T32_za158]|nr:hypothetical protein C0992_000350 [Termitomyces sp. T32_za158]
MSSPSASTSLVSPAVLAAWAYVPKLDMFLASLANIGLGADQKTVVGAIKVFKKWLWHKGQAVDVTWSWENKLREWCMARYVENLGAAWLASFKANFAPVPLLIDEHLASLLADDGPFLVSSPSVPKVTAYVDPLVQMDLARQEHMWAEAAAQIAAIMSAEWEAELLEEWRVALAKLLAKRTADARAAGFLEAVEVGAASSSEAVKTEEAAAGSAVTAGEAATAEPVDESEAPETDNDADDEDNVPAMPKRVLTTGSSGCLPAAIKRASKSTTPSKRCTQKVVPQYKPPTATTFTDAQLCNLLVPRRDEVVLDNDRCAGETVPGVKGKKTVSLAAHNNFKSLKGLIMDVVDLAPPTPKGKAKATSTPHKQRASTAGNKPSAKQSRSGTASRKVAKTIPRQEETPPVAGPSQQILPVNLVESVLRPGSMVLSEPESPSETEVQNDHEEVAKLSDLSESLSEVLAVPHRAVQPNYAPLPTPCVNGQEFIWLGKALDYPISALCPTEYIEAAKEKAEGITAVLRKDMWAAALEMEGLRLHKKIMECSVDILERYQADCTEALEWRQANKAHIQQPFTTLFPLLPGSSLDP